MTLEIIIIICVIIILYFLINSILIIYITVYRYSNWWFNVPKSNIFRTPHISLSQKSNKIAKIRTYKNLKRKRDHYSSRSLIQYDDITYRGSKTPIRRCPAGSTTRAGSFRFVNNNNNKNNIFFLFYWVDTNICSCDRARTRVCVCVCTCIYVSAHHRCDNWNRYFIPDHLTSIIKRYYNIWFWLYSKETISFTKTCFFSSKNTFSVN